MDPTAPGDDRRNRLRHARRGRSPAIDSQPSSLVATRPNGQVPRPPSRPAPRQIRDPDSHRRFAQQVGQPAAREDAAVVDDRHAVADPLDFGQEVGVQEHRRARSAAPPDDRSDVGPADRIEGRRRLVEDDERRPTEQRDAEPEPLLHALREPADQVVRPIGEPDVARTSSMAPALRSIPRPISRRGARGLPGPAARAGSGTARAGSRSGSGPRDRRAAHPGPCRGRRSDARDPGGA